LNALTLVEVLRRIQDALRIQARLTWHRAHSCLEDHALAPLLNRLARVVSGKSRYAPITILATCQSFLQ
jgi:hypothetical protein